MVHNPVKLHAENPDELSPLWNLYTCKLFNRLDIGIVIGHGSDIIQPVCIGHELQIGLHLTQLLSPSVQVAHDDLAVPDYLSIHPEFEPQHPVRAWMHRTHVQQKLLCFHLTSS